MDEITAHSIIADFTGHLEPMQRIIRAAVVAQVRYGGPEHTATDFMSDKWCKAAPGKTVQEFLAEVDHHWTPTIGIDAIKFYGDHAYVTRGGYSTYTWRLEL